MQAYGDTWLNAWERGGGVDFQASPYTQWIQSAAEAWCRHSLRQHRRSTDWAKPAQLPQWNFISANLQNAYIFIARHNVLCPCFVIGY